MTFSSGNVVAIVAVVGLLITIATVVGATFRSSRATQTLANYREAAQAWQMKSDAQGDEIRELQEQVSARDKRIDDLDRQLTELRGHMSALQELMVGSSALETLRADIHDSRDQILARMEAKP